MGEIVAISSINFQKAKAHSYAHNFRKDLPNYLLQEQDRKENFYWQNSKEPKEIFDDEMKILDEKKSKGKRASFENSHWEAVLNLNSNHSLDDVKKVAEHIEKKFNITCSTIAVHRDEGHYPLKKDGTKSDKAVYNYHAHINFITVKNGKQMWRRELITPSKLRELQTEVAELLGMQRGEDKRETKRERLEHKQYKQEIQKQEKLNLELENTKEKLTAEILSKKELKEQFETFRKENAGQGFAKEFFRELGDEKKKQLAEPSYTQEQLNAYFTDLLEKHTTKEKKLFKTTETTDWEAIAKEQQKTISDLNAKNDDLKQNINQAIDFIVKEKENDLNAKFEALKEQNELELTQELRKERQKLQTLADLTLKKKDELEAEQELYRTKYQELSQDEVIKQIEANKNQEINKLKTKNAELEKKNETLKQENSKLKLLLKGAEELKEIIKEQLSKELEKAKEQITKLTNTIQRAMQMSFICSYDRKNKYEMKHIYFKDFTKQSDQEQESTMQSNIKAVKDRELEKQREEQAKKQTKIRTNRGFER